MLVLFGKFSESSIAVLLQRMKMVSEVKQDTEKKIAKCLAMQMSFCNRIATLSSFGMKNARINLERGEEAVLATTVVFESETGEVDAMER